MKTWCFGQFFILVGFLKTTQTLEQFGGYLSARLEKKEKVLHFVVLRHKILTVLNQFKKKYLRSYIEVEEFLTRITAQQVKKSNICNNHFLELKERTFKNVPRSPELAKRGDQIEELFFDPHVGVFTQSQNSISYASFGMLCLPKSTQFMPDSERKSLSLMFLESPHFYFNVSFEKFSMQPHPWCFSEFVVISHHNQSSSSVPTFIFCGQRHSWAMIYTRNTMKVWIVARRTSILDFKFQISDPQNILTFHICQYFISDKDHPCHVGLPYHFWITHAFSFLWKNSVVKKYVVSIVTLKFSVLTIENSAVFDNIFDGPTIEHRRMPLRNRLQMSSFQATAIVTSYSFLLRRNQTAFFSQTPFCSYFPNYSKAGTKLVLNKSCQRTDCLVHEVYCLRTPDGHAVNITLIDAVYTGPREPFHNNYGGISVFFSFEPGQTFEVLATTSDMLLEQDFKQLTLISDSDTKYVFITFHYFPKFCLMRGELFISKTACKGFCLKILPCKPSFQYFSWNFIFHHFLEVTPNDTCMVVSIQVSHHTILRVFDEEAALHTCIHSARHFSSVNILKGLPLQTDLVWEQLEIYNMAFAFNSPGNYTLFENLKQKGTSLRGTTTSHLKFHKDNPLPDVCDSEYVSEYMKVMPQQYSKWHLTEETDNPQNGTHVRISTTSSQNSIGTTFDLFINPNTMQNKWAIFSLYLLNCSSSEVAPLWFPYTSLEKERFCGKEQVQYGKWEKSMKLQGFRTHFVSVFSSCYGRCTGIISNVYRDNSSKLAFVVDDISDYYKIMALPFTQVVSKSVLSINMTLRFTKISNYFHFHHRLFDTNLSMLMPSNETEILIPTTVLPYCAMDKESWIKQPCQFMINPEQPLTFQRFNISIRTLPVQDLSSFGHFFHLFSACSNALGYCFRKFVSWKQADKMCREMNMILPTIHSLKDLKDIQSMVDGYQRKLSCLKDSKMPHSVEILYSVIGMFIGINFDVSLVQIYPLWLTKRTKWFVFNKTGNRNTKRW